MNPYEALLNSLEHLQAQKRQLQEQGLVLFDCWIGQSRPGGTAINPSCHYQLRSRKAQFNGKKSRYLKASEVRAFRGAIARGKIIKQLNRQILTIEQKLARIEAIAAVANLG